MSNRESDFRRLEINGGQVQEADGNCLLKLPATLSGYADAQIDDYGGFKRSAYPHRAGASFSLRARFSHGSDALKGTAGFGFWNAPFGDPTVRWPALPQAAWFFFASEPGDLPLAKDGPGRGWFAGTLDAGSVRALAWAPLAPAVVLLNRWRNFRTRVWPAVQNGLSISFAPLDVDMTAWHAYRLNWQASGCFFSVDGQPVLQTPFSPRGPLGFVCWLDNQYLVVTPTGRMRWGSVPTAQNQFLELTALLVSTDSRV